MQMRGRNIRGFTIVELLIVIVVIAILAAISTVAYNGLQQRARDSQRKSDVSSIIKALELYYTDNGQYPPGAGSTSINSGWSTTADSSWQTLRSRLVPKYMSELPRDPVSTAGISVIAGSSVGQGYAYFANTSGFYCGTGTNQTFILVYRLETSANSNSVVGDCSTNPLGPYGGASNYVKAKA